MRAFAFTKTAIDFERNPNAWTDQESAAQIYSFKNMSFYLYLLGTLLVISFISVLVEQFYAKGLDDIIYDQVIGFVNVQKRYIKSLNYHMSNFMQKKSRKKVMIAVLILFVFLCIAGIGLHLLFNNKFEGKKLGICFSLIYMC